MHALLREARTIASSRHLIIIFHINRAAMNIFSLNFQLEMPKQMEQIPRVGYVAQSRLQAAENHKPDGYSCDTMIREMRNRLEMKRWNHQSLLNLLLFVWKRKKVRAIRFASTITANEQLGRVQKFDTWRLSPACGDVFLRRF